uniref:Uncharacterized protein n=1 Tax=Echeneis naucrates TaxID=173247 RepID=A0A665UFL0_ECHNA
MQKLKGLLFSESRGKCVKNRLMLQIAVGMFQIWGNGPLDDRNNSSCFTTPCCSGRITTTLSK